MTKTFTPKESAAADLISYAYNENGLLDSDRIQRMIDSDPIIESEYKEIVSVINILDSVKVEPSEKCMQRILSFC